jgi:hypothetical protein
MKVRWTTRELAEMGKQVIIIGEEELKSPYMEDTRTMLEEITGTRIIAFEVEEQNGELVVIAEIE